MRMAWGREKSAGGLSIQPVYTYVLVLLSIVATLGAQGFRYEQVWTPLERHYFGAYSASQIAGVVRDNGWYTLLQVVTRKGSRFALESDIVSAVTESGENTFALTEEALKHGAMRLEFHRSYCNNSEMHAYLRSWIYQNQTFMDLVRPALWAGLLLFFAGLLPATYLDRKRSIALRNGKKPSGPNLVNVAKPGQTVQSSQEAPCSTTQRESPRPGAGRACASGTSQESSPECGNRSRVPSEPHATGISATRATAEAGTRVGARREAHHEALFRIREHAYHFQASQCRSSTCLSSGGV
jgi:hypothetical protein